MVSSAQTRVFDARRGRSDRWRPTPRSSAIISNSRPRRRSPGRARPTAAGGSRPLGVVGPGEEQHVADQARQAFVLLDRRLEHGTVFGRAARRTARPAPRRADCRSACAGRARVGRERRKPPERALQPVEHAVEGEPRFDELDGGVVDDLRSSSARALIRLAARARRLGRATIRRAIQRPIAPDSAAAITGADEQALVRRVRSSFLMISVSASARRRSSRTAWVDSPR